MAKFTKASPKQAYLKVAMYGPAGSGKTIGALLIAEGLAKYRGGRIKYVDVEHGTDFYAMDVKDRLFHPSAFDFDAVYTKSLSETTESILSLDPKEPCVVVNDQISQLWDSAIEAYCGKMNRADAIPMHAWGKIKKPYKALIKHLIGAPYDLIILGRQKNSFVQDPVTGELIKDGVAMKAEGDTAYEPHICIRLEAKGNVHSAFVEKDHVGMFQGKTFTNINFDSISSLLPLLGKEQAKSEDEEERVFKDGELLSADDDKAKAKEAKSAELMRTLQAKLITATSIEECKNISAEVAKSKRYLTEEHFNLVVEIGKSKREELTK
jgi:hypothetical protein